MNVEPIPGALRTQIRGFKPNQIFVDSRYWGGSGDFRMEGFFTGGWPGNDYGSFRPERALRGLSEGIAGSVDGELALLREHRLGLIQLNSFIYGHDCLDDLEEFRNDPLLEAAMKGEVAAPRTIGDFLRDFEL